MRVKTPLQERAVNRNKQYWTELAHQEADFASTHSTLASVALGVLCRMPPNVEMVCGPITTGGLGSVEANLFKFNQTIDKLIARGVNLFDQVPFEQHIARIARANGGRDNMGLLRDFYLPLFESGRITRLYFIKGWESSEGASWEHAQALRLGIEIVYL